MGTTGAVRRHIAIEVGEATPGTLEILEVCEHPCGDAKLFVAVLMRKSVSVM